VLPKPLAVALQESGELHRLTELVLDLGRRPEAVFPDRTVAVSDEPVDREMLRYIVEQVGDFTSDNRAGIERTLHRISALRNRRGEIVGLTCRVGRAVRGAADLVRDVIDSGKSLLLVGRPGVGKTTLLREAARLLADERGKRVLIVDTSNEIGGDGDIPHPGIGRARRLQVPSPERQHAVMIEAVENHMPEVIVIDEIGTEAEARAARTIAERGVQLIATAHGNSLENLIANPTLSDLVGGIEAVTLSDEEARRRGSQKTILERRTTPTFSALIEILDQDRLAVHHDVGEVVDRLLQGEPVWPELRKRRVDTSQGSVATTLLRKAEPPSLLDRHGFPTPVRPVRVFPYGIPKPRLERAIRDLGVAVVLVNQPDAADCVVALKSQARRLPPLLRNVPVHLLRSKTPEQIEAFLTQWLGPHHTADSSPRVLREVEQAIAWVEATGRSVELAPRSRVIRRIQQERIAAAGLGSIARGPEPYRRVVVLPRKESPS
jgi:stage III sporulation protein SpoIIIAA